MRNKFNCVIEDACGRRFDSINLAECKEIIQQKLENTDFKLISIELANNCLVFGIDFDGTFAADPEAFKDIIESIVRHGHKAVFVTGRDNKDGFGDEVRDLINDTFGDKASEFSIVFAGSKWKKQAALDAGYKVNIWIDDNPEYIGPQRITHSEKNYDVNLDV